MTVVVAAAALVANPPDRDAFVHDTLLIFLEASWPATGCRWPADALHRSCPMLFVLGLASAPL